MKTEIAELLVICKKAKALIASIEREAKVIVDSADNNKADLSKIDICTLSLSSKKLHTHFIHICEVNNICTLEDLVKLRPTGFLRISGVGKTLYTDVTKALRWQYKIKW